MSNVAIAGGTGALGRTIVEELEVDNKHHVFVLSRSDSPQQASGATTLKVDYTSIDSLVQCLEENRIEIIISTIYLTSDNASQSQLNLIEAAERSRFTKKFIPSEFSIILTDDAEALQKSSLQWSRFAVGFFMDYWGMPHVKSNLNFYPWAIHMEACKAAIPGDGNDLMTLTHTVDVAKAIVAVLGWSQWPERFTLSAQDITLNEMLRLAEEVRGRRFDVVYDDLEALEANNPTLLSDALDQGASEHVKLVMSVLGRMVVRGVTKLPTTGRLNERLPEWKPMQFETLIKEAWEGR